MAKASSQRRKKKSKIGLKGTILLCVVIMMGMVFMGGAVFLLIAMAPSFVAVISDRSKDRLRSFSICFMNFAGAFPFLLDVITTNQSIDYALNAISQPATVVIIYASAGIGYLINWAVVGIVANMMVQKAKKRLNTIEERKATLREQWGPEVTGEMKLDSDGFPIEPENIQNPK